VLSNEKWHDYAEPRMGRRLRTFMADSALDRRSTGSNWVASVWNGSAQPCGSLR
jgi:hypothetical protein